METSNIKYDDKGKIVGGNVKWIGGINWRDAVDKYNGGGDPAYMPKYDASTQALSQNASSSGAAENAKPKQ